MAFGEVVYDWRLDLRASPEALWPLVADTDRFDRDAGTPPVQHLTELDAELTNARCVVRQRVAGITLQYQQEPFEWTWPDRFSVVRNYTRGPLAQLGVVGRLSAGADGGTRCDYQVRVRPRGSAGRLAIPLQIGVLYKRTFLRTFRHYDELALAGTMWAATNGTPKLVTGARERLQQAQLALGSTPTSDALLDLLRSGDDVTVSRLRPYAMADAWGEDRSEVLETFLYAAREGIVSFRWDVLCPMCGVAKASVEHLQELPHDVHCATCNIDYEANFDRSVELCFRATPAIRALSTDEYCIGSPMATPHVVAQVLLQPGDDVRLQPGLTDGRHRVRAYELPGAASLVVREHDAASHVEVSVNAGGWPGEELALTTDASVVVRNDTVDEQLVLLERTAWNDQAVTAAEVTALQGFRDLFASEALRPGEQISVGSLTVVFTDLRSSTQLYQRVGDAVAFGHVMDHFDALRDAITHNDGAIVKTIGDAVMAVFSAPADAVRALLEANAAVGAITAGGEPLALKAGVHHGPCIAVTLNGQLDYFGTSVNLAARLEGLATGGEIVLSESAHRDPEVAALLADGTLPVCEPVLSELKGFPEPVGTYRLHSR